MMAASYRVVYYPMIATPATDRFRITPLAKLSLFLLSLPSSSIQTADIDLESSRLHCN